MDSVQGPTLHTQAIYRKLSFLATNSSFALEVILLLLLLLCVSIAGKPGGGIEQWESEGSLGEKKYLDVHLFF